jgi:hypothetical protein
MFTICYVFVTIIIIYTGVLRKGRELLSFPVKTEKNKNERKVLLLGSSHVREIGLMLQEILGTKFDVCSIFKANASFAKVVEDIGKHGKGITKQDHIIVVGGPGNIMHRDYHYSIENYFNFIQRGHQTLV